MAFEVRKAGGNKYLYLSRRDPLTGRVKKRYVGTGPKADAAAKALAARRQQRDAERLAIERLGAELRSADALTAELDEAATLVMEAVLLTAGFHRANYSRWRKRRARDGQGGTGERPATDAPVDEHAELRAVIAKAKAGDASVLPQLRAILDGNPALVERYGNLGRQAEAAWVALAAGTNLYMREAFARAADARRAELTRPGATPMELLLVARVVACDLQLNYLAAAEADALGAGDSYRLVDYHAKRVERAQRMFLSATGALVTFQKLVPAARLVAEPVAPINSRPTKTEQTAEPRTVADAAGRVSVATESVEPDEARSEPHDRLRVGVTY